jgi:hypothetical protein
MNSIPQIGFLFLTRGEINNPDIWIQYFKNVDPNKYRLFIHPKDPKALRSALWSKNTVILNPIATNWGTISIVKATLILLNAANNNPNIKKFILVSESCIPTCSFDKLYDSIMCHNLSYISYNFSLNIDRLKIINNTSNLNLTTNLWAKQSQWMILDKKHVHMIFLNNIKNTLYLNCFQYCPAADEHYFINFLIHICKCDQKTIINKKTTYVDWSTKLPHPRTFHYLDRNLVDYCKKNEMFFARKFANLNLSKSDLDHLLDISIVETPLEEAVVAEAVEAEAVIAEAVEAEAVVAEAVVAEAVVAKAVVAEAVVAEAVDELDNSNSDSESEYEQEENYKEIKKFTPQQTDILIQLNADNILNLSDQKINLIYDILFSNNNNTKLDKETQTEETSKPLDIISTPQEETSTPLDIISTPQEDTSRPLDIISRPLDDTSRPLEDTSKLEDETSRPLDDTSKLEDETSRPLDDTSKLEDETSRPLDDTSKLEDETSRPLEDTSILEDETSRPLEDTSILEDETSRPLEHTSKLEDETSRPLEDTSRPLEDTSRPLEDTSRPLEDTSRPLDIIITPQEEINEDFHLKQYKKRLIEINRELLLCFNKY